MKKKELVKTLMERMQKFGYFPSFTNVKIFIREYEKLTNSEPEIPVVPQFVAEWIEYCKHHNFTLFGCFDPENGFERLTGESFEGDARKCIRWCRRASDKVARAWLDGYDVEEETKYTVKIIKTKQYLYRRDNDFCFVTYVRPDDNPHNCHTREELEEAGFGEVFNCPLFEVEEVE